MIFATLALYGCAGPVAFAKSNQKRLPCTSLLPPLLRSSARAEGAFELIFERFAMRATRTRMRASGSSLTIDMSEGLDLVREIGKSRFIKPNQSTEL